MRVYKPVPPKTPGGRREGAGRNPKIIPSVRDQIRDLWNQIVLDSHRLVAACVGNPDFLKVYSTPGGLDLATKTAAQMVKHHHTLELAREGKAQVNLGDAVTIPAPLVIVLKQVEQERSRTLDIQPAQELDPQLQTQPQQHASLQLPAQSAVCSSAISIPGNGELPQTCEPLGASQSEPQTELEKPSLSVLSSANISRLKQTQG